ncbi:hypothetical protein [Thermohalobacter berrensis]|uniref:Uncharacterized protein n=1 Tax=Thermohalobacter berrensis TaxID=99594 RepID=A0A419TB65_9FIRM|nr:hypothetical protein [Thermohalobacter berrensis]RKD34687.1 hypothetical protein BET03_02350 [Thermohalobacter berrensis]
MFSTWVYDYKKIPIKNYEWIWRHSYTELDIYWSVHNGPNQSQVYIRFNQTGEEYLGFFKKDNKGEYYLEVVIEGKLKKGQRPKSLFDKF